MTDVKPQIRFPPEASPGLTAWGWDVAFAREFTAAAAPGMVPGRVISEHTHIYRLRLEEGEILARLSGRMRMESRRKALYPAVGDWVALKTRKGENEATIHAILPRRTRFARKVPGARMREQVAAANIDVALLISAMDNNFSVRRLERYHVLALESGAQPVVVLNKADMWEHTDIGEFVDEATGACPGAPVIVIAAETGHGFDALMKYLAPGRTAVALGISGVGKSTLINELSGDIVMDTQEVRESDSRGRHTTTYRAMFMLPGGAMIVDTPGVRELQLWRLGQEERIEDSFEDIEALAARCRFRDCRHESEPGCAVVGASEAGELETERLESYRRLRAELERLAELKRNNKG